MLNFKKIMAVCVLLAVTVSTTEMVAEDVSESLRFLSRDSYKDGTWKWDKTAKKCKNGSKTPKAMANTETKCKNYASLYLSSQNLSLIST